MEDPAAMMPPGGGQLRSATPTSAQGIFHGRPGHDSRRCARGTSRHERSPRRHLAARGPAPSRSQLEAAPEHMSAARKNTSSWSLVEGSAMATHQADKGPKAGLKATISRPVRQPSISNRVPIFVLINQSIIGGCSRNRAQCSDENTRSRRRLRQAQPRRAHSLRSVVPLGRERTHTHNARLHIHSVAT